MITRFWAWLDHWAARVNDARLQRCFDAVNPDSITDIDKYLRSRGLMP
jgi:hypothetical protein